LALLQLRRTNATILAWFGLSNVVLVSNQGAFLRPVISRPIVVYQLSF